MDSMTVRLVFDGRKWYVVISQAGRVVERYGWLMSLPA